MPPFTSETATTASTLPKKKPETVIKAIWAFLGWMAQGKSIQSFSYEDPNDKDEYCSWQTVLNYLSNKEFIEEHKLAFVAEHRVIAKSKGYSVWEKVCEESARGDNKEANTASLQMIMRNKFGWDKNTDDKGEVDTRKFEVLKEFFTHVNSLKQSTESDTKSSSVPSE